MITPTSSDITFLSGSNRPLQTSAITPRVMTQPRMNGGSGMKQDAKIAATLATAAVEIAPVHTWPIKTTQTTQCRGPGVLPSMSIMHSPVHTV